MEKNDLVCTEVVANNVDSSETLSKSSDKKPKQARKKVANINLDTDGRLFFCYCFFRTDNFLFFQKTKNKDDKESESGSIQETETFIGNEEISPTKRALVPVDSSVAKSSKSGEKKKPPKPRKKLADINLESSGKNRFSGQFKACF